MSAGSTHLRASLLLSAAFVVASVQEPRLLECAAGSMLGCIVGPDLDCDSGNISNYIIRKKVGWFGERLWRWFWRPYSESFKHRGFASHFPVFSTAVRLLYIFMFILVPLYFFGSNPAWIEWTFQKMFLSFFTVGLCASDLIHWTLDVLTKER